jgi:hypothetical protein
MSKQAYLDKVDRFNEIFKDNPDYVPETDEDKALYEQYMEESAEPDEETYNPNLPLYIKIDLEISTTTKGYTPPTPLKKSIVILSGDEGRDDYDKMLVNGFYVHGRAGIFDEMDYTDNDLSNQILPTK